MRVQEKVDYDMEHSAGKLFNGPEWKSLDKIDRAQLLLVLEGLKRGTIISGNWTSFMDILEKTGLVYKLNTNQHRLNPVVMVARPENLLEYNRRVLTLPENSSRDDFHEIAGWFLGYPTCCTDEYLKERTPEQMKADENGKRHLSYRLGQELDAAIKNGGTYPDVLDYRPPSFTPCTINCPEATKVLASWKEAIDRLDPEAGKELVYFNRRSFPERLVHKESLDQERQRRNLEFMLESLRRGGR